MKPIIAIYMMVLCGLLLLPACSDGLISKNNQSKKIAQVGNRTLYQKDLSKVISEGLGSADSLAIVNGYVEQWIRRSVLVTAAEESVGGQLDIEALVASYRSSLLISNYEEQYLSQRLDTLVTATELEEMYQLHKGSFTLASDLYRLHIAAIDAKSRGLETFYKNWQKGDLAKIKMYVADNAINYKLDSIWISQEVITEYLPEGLFRTKSFKTKAILQKNQAGIEYFVKVLDAIDKGEQPPLAYVKEKLTEIILQKRKKALKQKLESDLYRQALASNKIRVYKK